MKNLENGTEFIWTKEKFLNRLYLMKEMYSNYEEEEDDWDLPEVLTNMALSSWQYGRALAICNSLSFCPAIPHYRKKIRLPRI